MELINDFLNILVKGVEYGRGTADSKLLAKDEAAKIALETLKEQLSNSEKSQPVPAQDNLPRSLKEHVTEQTPSIIPQNFSSTGKPSDDNSDFDRSNSRSRVSPPLENEIHIPKEDEIPNEIEDSVDLDVVNQINHGPASESSLATSLGDFNEMPGYFREAHHFVISGGTFTDNSNSLQISIGNGSRTSTSNNQR
ncbi:hypothetical protein BDQ17DRAFT_1334682 [Cyathus striatus]|nr:hypothetical protein BDQ17DRAFT_1334682 [Cyathus striatus]